MTKIHKAEIEESEPVEADIVATGIFDDAPVTTSPDLPDLVGDLSEDQRQEFVRLLNEKMTLAERADQLVKLARFSDTKRAPVGLRAIQAINELTGVSEKPTENQTPMFAIPVQISISQTKVDE